MKNVVVSYLLVPRKDAFAQAISINFESVLHNWRRQTYSASIVTVLYFRRRMGRLDYISPYLIQPWLFSRRRMGENSDQVGWIKYWEDSKNFGILFLKY